MDVSSTYVFSWQLSITSVYGRSRNGYLAGAMASSLASVAIEDIQAWYVNDILEE
jgi:hypothetical protein